MDTAPRLPSAKFGDLVVLRFHGLTVELERTDGGLIAAGINVIPAGE